VTVRADRFSPYFNRPEAYGIALEPLSAYRHLFPFDETSVRRLAYHFEIVDRRTSELEKQVTQAIGKYDEWRSHQSESALWCDDDGSTITVYDHRWGWPRSVTVLDAAAAALHRLCWQITSWREVQAKLGAGFSMDTLKAAAEDLAERGLLIEEADKLLVLTLRQPGYRRAPSWEEIRTASIASPNIPCPRPTLQPFARLLAKP
jgi:magnesium-protoporphyrin IX monomethyl ester (oxidative) cyclase